MARPPAKCGTEGGYRRHTRLKEPYCEPCKKAHAELAVKQRAQRAERKQKAEQEKRDEAIRSIKTDVTARVEDLDELADLIYQRDSLKDALEIVKTTEPAKISPLSKELREVHKRIGEILAEDKDTEPEGGALDGLLYSG